METTLLHIELRLILMELEYFSKTNSVHLFHLSKELYHQMYNN